MQDMYRYLQSQAASDTVFLRGVTIAQSGGVHGLKPDYSLDGYVEVFGSVDSQRSDDSSQTSYAAFAEFAIDGGAVSDYGCSCPAAEKYEGMCKHVVALSLTYFARIGAVPSYLASPSSPAPTRKQRAFTSPLIEQFVNETAKRAQAAAQESLNAPAASASDEAQAQPAELTCIISKGSNPRDAYTENDGMWSLGLKVSRGAASYVVKSLSALIDARVHGTWVEYGKNLAFAHKRTAFSTDANALLDFLEPIVSAQNALHEAQQSRRRWENLSYSTKTIPLTQAQMARLLKTRVGSQVVVEQGTRNVYRGTTKSKREVPVVEGVPRLEVSIQKDAGGNFELAIEPSDVSCIAGETCLCLVAQNVIVVTDEEYAADLGLFLGTVLPMHSIAHIRAQDMPAFCDAVLPALRVHTQLDAPEDLDQLLPPQPAFTFHIDEEDGAVVCFAQVAYDDTQMDLFEPARQGQPARDIVRETASQGLVRRYFPQGDTLSPDYAHPLPAYLGTSEQRARTNASIWGRTYGSSYDNDPFYADSASPYSDGAPQHVFGQGERAFQQADRFDKPARRTHRTPWFPSEDDAALYTLLTDGLQDLANVGDVFLSEQLKRVNVREVPKVQVSARVSGGLLDLRVESDGMSPAELVSYLASYKRKKRFLRLSNGDIVKLDGGVRAVSELAGVLDVSEQSLVDGTAEVSANRTLFVDALLKRAAGVRLKRNESFRRIVRDFETVADADYPEPENLNGSLRPYQVEGFKWLSTLGHVGFGGILADEMGLGKTLQAIAYLLARKNEATEDSPAKPALIVCPASLVYNWTAEIQRFAPSLRVQPVVAAKRERAQAIRDAESQDVLVTSYDLMKRDIDAYEPQRFSCVILDEAQYIKNSATKAAKCAKRLSADVRFALTGTPIENRLSELWSIFDFLMPGVLGSREAFGRRFSKPIEDGDEQAAKRLQSLVGPFILRRLKADVLTDLPEKNESTVLASMEGEQLKLYRSNEQRLALTLSKQMPQEFATEKLKILAELTKLRQICCDPNLLYDNYKGDSAKLETCLELVRQAVDSGHSILLFSQFTSMLDIIEQRLDKEKIGHLKLTGQTSKEDRVKLVSRFQSHEAPVFLISLKAGGVGLNLTAADIVIHYDPWWNLAAQNQATDRAHRIGQTKDVSVFKLIAKDTIEERIVKMQESKRDLAESVIGGEASATASLTREDVLALLESESQE